VLCEYNKDLAAKCKFSEEPNGERLLKTGQYLPKLRLQWNVFDSQCKHGGARLTTLPDSLQCSAI